VLLIAHGFKEPALRSRRAQNAAASTASRPASVTIAIRPSVGQDGGINKAVSTKRRSEIFSLIALDTKMTRQPVGQISRPVRRGKHFRGLVPDLNFVHSAGGTEI
jgi:hypothetical protein